MTSIRTSTCYDNAKSQRDETLVAAGSRQCQVAARRNIGSNKVLKRNVNPGRDAMTSVMPTALRLCLGILGGRRVAKPLRSFLVSGKNVK